MAQGQEQAAPDAVPTRIGQVAMLHHAGDREEARRRFLGLWAELDGQGDPLHRCTLARYLADTQDDPADELAWDLRALSAAEEFADDRLAGHASAPAARALYPALHLDLAADYDRLGRRDAARVHLRRARRAAHALADDRYGRGVRAAIGRLAARLDDGHPGDGPGAGPGGGDPGRGPRGGDPGHGPGGRDRGHGPGGDDPGAGPAGGTPGGDRPDDGSPGGGWPQGGLPGGGRHGGGSAGGGPLGPPRRRS